jgi:Fic family protein
VYRYTITDAIRSDLDRLEALRVRLDADAFLARTWSGHMRRELESAAIGASVSMEGVPVTVDEVRRILAGEQPKGVSENDAALVVGYREAMRMVLRRADDPSFHWQTELVKNVHERVLAGSWAAGAGRFREHQVFVVHRESGEVSYTPPAPAAVPGLVEGLASWLEAKAHGLPAPVAAALAHARAAGIHPFRDGNGRTSRILASLVMYRAGYRLPQFTSLEEWWGGHLADYYGAFDCLGSAWDADADVTPFVAAHVRAQASQAASLELRQRTERLLWTALEELAMQSGTDPRGANALFDAVMGRSVTSGYYRRLIDMTTPTAVSDLKRLEAAGLLVRSGAGRSTAYAGTVLLVARVAGVAGVALDTTGLTAADDALRSALFAAMASRAERAAPMSGPGAILTRFP